MNEAIVSYGLVRLVPEWRKRALQWVVPVGGLRGTPTTPGERVAPGAGRAGLQRRG